MSKQLQYGQYSVQTVTLQCPNSYFKDIHCPKYHNTMSKKKKLVMTYSVQITMSKKLQSGHTVPK